MYIHKYIHIYIYIYVIHVTCVYVYVYIYIYIYREREIYKYAYMIHVICMYIYTDSDLEARPNGPLANVFIRWRQCGINTSLETVIHGIIYTSCSFISLASFAIIFWYGLWFSTEIYWNKRERTVFRKNLRNNVLFLRKSPKTSRDFRELAGECNLGILYSRSLLHLGHNVQKGARVQDS